jgi:fatty-acyl-CoA synthase
MRIVLWRGYHDGEFAELVGCALGGGLLLIACPPETNDFGFLNQLPEGEIELRGDWIGFSAPTRVAEGGAYPVSPCLGVFTSATTENAKLVLYSRENVESCARSIFALFRHHRIKSVFCYPQPFHTFGLTLGYAAAHLMGWRLTVPAGKYSRHHHEEWVKSVGENSLTLGTPTHFLDLMQFLKDATIRPPRSYSAIVGGARVTRSLWIALRDELRIEAPSIGYGATEASPGVSHLAPGVEPVEDGEVGLPLPHLEVVVDPLSGVTFSGPSVCCAIIHEGRVEFPDSFVLPDLLRVRSDGSMIFMGRAKFTLNRGGRKILLEAIEKEILAHFGIETLAISVPDHRLGEELGLLLCTPCEDLCVRREELVGYLRDKFGVNFSSSHIRAVTQFPLNANMKPDRRAAINAL